MERGVTDVLQIALELVLCSLLLGAIVLCTISGRTLQTVKANSDDAYTIVANKADLYYYDNRMVTTSDIIELILTNTNKYEYEINIVDAGGNITETREFSAADALANNKSKGYWSEENVGQFVKGLENCKFVSVLRCAPGSNDVDGVLFYYTGG